MGNKGKGKGPAIEAPAATTLGAGDVQYGDPTPPVPPSTGGGGTGAGDPGYTDPMPGEGKGNGEAKNPRVAYVLKGTVAGFDAEARTVTVSVADRGGATNRHARVFRGTDVVFSLSGAKVKVADTNGDGERNADDVQAGAPVKVLAKLPKTLGSGSQPYAAKIIKIGAGGDATPTPEPEESNDD